MKRITVLGIEEKQIEAVKIVKNSVYVTVESLDVNGSLVLS